MTAEKAKQKSQTPLVTYVLIFIFGFLTGVGFTVYKTTSAGVSSTSADNQQSNVQSNAQDEETHQAILNLEAEVTSDPKNFQAWRQLGNLYYDHDDSKKAIGAYLKSLESSSGDANLLTDLGVMYRRTKQPQKAIEVFNKAIQMSPEHEPSRFNKGIVLMYDLNDAKNAIASWEELLAINPQAKTANGESIRDLVERAKNELSAK